MNLTIVQNNETKKLVIRSIINYDSDNQLNHIQELIIVIVELYLYGRIVTKPLLFLLCFRRRMTKLIFVALRKIRQ
jgi:hypothetical protein